MTFCTGALEEEELEDDAFTEIKKSLNVALRAKKTFSV
jgi:hypothetical protein